ncbi:M1 family aminopeptidase [Geothrix oryzisoli]|uniref:M1 family aminopeptidase n=1 Tax=Geothrix oryzisoli TaxID=2922721 RepID=UPI001FAC86B3|nr:M1 family aminopeptidase [Geothrix oryzisoli]
MTVMESLWLRMLLSLGLCLGGAGLAGQEVPDPFGAVAALKPGPVRNLEQQATFTVGNAHIQFTGHWAPLLRGDQKVGLFLEGNGSLTYVSSFEPEWPILERNCKDLGMVTPTREGQTRMVAFPFTRARILLAGASFPTWGGDSSGDLTGLAAFVERWQKVDGYFPDHLLAAQAMNAPGRMVAFIELERNDQRWLYRYDGVDAMEETLAVVRPLRSSIPDLGDWHDPVTVSRQFLGWNPRKDPTPVHVRINALEVDLRTADNRQAAMTVQETLMPLEDGLRVVTFDLWSTLAEPTGTRHLRIKRVVDGTGAALAFSHSHDKLAVCFPAPATRGVPLTLRLEYDGDFLIRPRGDNYWQLGVKEGWYPTLENLSGEWYTFHGTVRTQGEWQAFLPGDTVRREKDGVWNLVETRTDRPICFATILGGKYSVDEEVRDGLTVRIATYGFKPGAVNKVFKEQTRNVIRYYETFLGPFPFKEFLIIEKNEWGYGQAPPGMMYITRDAFEQAQTIRQMQELADLVGRYRGRNISISTMDVRHVLAHEIAHQYWGIVVKMPSRHDQWVTESFADYCAGLYERDYKGKGRFDKDIATWRSDAERSKDQGPIPLANDIHFDDRYESFLARRDLLYAKGPVLLHALHQELGDQVFLTWLKSSQTNFRWKFASTARLFDLLKFITKKDYTPFLDTYFWGLGLPPAKP